MQQMVRGSVGLYSWDKLTFNVNEVGNRPREEVCSVISTVEVHSKLVEVDGGDVERTAVMKMAPVDPAH
jgi:hypothetical protein